MSKVTIPIDPDLKDAKFIFPDNIPVTLNFDRSRLIGFCNIENKAGELIIDADFKTADAKRVFDVDKITPNYALAGVVIEREGNVIKEFKVYECSIVPKI